MNFSILFLGLACSVLVVAHALDPALAEKMSPAAREKARADAAKEEAQREAIAHHYQTMWAGGDFKQSFGGGNDQGSNGVHSTKVFGPSDEDLLYKEGCAPLADFGNGKEDRPFNSQDGLTEYAVADRFTDKDFDAYADTFKSSLSPDHLKQFLWEICDLRQRHGLSNDRMGKEYDGSEYKRKIMRVMDAFQKIADKDLAEHPSLVQHVKQALFGSVKDADADKDVQLNAAVTTPPSQITTSFEGLKNLILACSLLTIAGLVVRRRQERNQTDSSTVVQPLVSDAEGPSCDFQPFERTAV